MIQQNEINEYVILLLEFLQKNFHLLSTFQKYKPSAFDNDEISSVSESNIFTTDTFKFDVQGKTLLVMKIQLHL